MRLRTPHLFFDATQRAEQENVELRAQRAELLGVLGGITLNETLAAEKNSQRIGVTRVYSNNTYWL